jgi:LmbE family N-acetylglucosaminyl deacetylase
MEYGAASAVARWTAQGKVISYVLVTDGEAGIATMAPDAVAPLRREEQRDSCAVVGVDGLQFLGRPDGLVTVDLELRADLAEVVRRHRPEVVLASNFRDTWGGPSWNHADHRAVGTALLDAVRDAANPWLFTDRGEAWDGVRLVAFAGSPRSTHAVDVTDTLAIGIASLECHRTYLDHLGVDADAVLRDAARATGPRLGVELAVPFEVITP